MWPWESIFGNISIFSINSQYVTKHANECHDGQLVQLHVEQGAAMLDWI